MAPVSNNKEIADVLNPTSGENNYAKNHMAKKRVNFQNFKSESKSIREFDGKIDEGQEAVNKKRKEILYDGYYYDVTDFMRRHPGGRIIEMYTEYGEDATLAIQQFHHRASNKVFNIMSKLDRRPATDLIPSSGGENSEKQQRYENMTKDFTNLYKELVDEGCFEPSTFEQISRISQIVLLYSLCLYGALALERTTLVYISICLIYAVIVGEAGFLMHENGHRSFTGSKNSENVLQNIFFGYISGLSASWWRSQHNRHHAMPQRLNHDVDLNTLPLLAFNAKVVTKTKGQPNFFVRNQVWLFATVDVLLVSLFWKLYLCPRYAIKNRKYSELFAIVNVPEYLTATWLGSFYVFFTFALNHTHLPVTEEPAHWVEYSLVHTQDIDSDNYFVARFVDWWMGNLSCQIEHHLFPTMPEFRNRQVKERVKALAKKYNLPYRSQTYTEAVVTTFKNLHHVSSQLESL